MATARRSTTKHKATVKPKAAAAHKANPKAAARKAAPKSTGTARKAAPRKVASVAAEPHAAARKARGVRLLAGGNPQIAMADGNAPVQAYLAALPGWKRDVARQIDAIIGQAVPAVHKAVKWNSPLYGLEGQGWFLSLHAFTRYLKISFFRGQALRPLPPGTSKSKDTRYLDVHEGDALDEAQLAAWVRQAAAQPGWRS